MQRELRSYNAGGQVNIGKPKEVVEVKEPAVPYKGVEVPSEEPEKVPVRK